MARDPKVAQTLKTLRDKLKTGTIPSVVNRLEYFEDDQNDDGTLDWFKREGIYGTDLPKYRLDYSLNSGPKG